VTYSGGARCLGCRPEEDHPPSGQLGRNGRSRRRVGACRRRPIQRASFTSSRWTVWDGLIKVGSPRWVVRGGSEDLRDRAARPPVVLGGAAEQGPASGAPRAHRRRWRNRAAGADGLARWVSPWRRLPSGSSVLDAFGSDAGFQASRGRRAVRMWLVVHPGIPRGSGPWSPSSLSVWSSAAKARSKSWAPVSERGSPRGPCIRVPPPRERRHGHGLSVRDVPRGPRPGPKTSSAL